MRPTIAVRLLLMASAVLVLSILFLTLLKELLREMKASEGDKRTFLSAASWFTTEAVDRETPASFSPSEIFSWKGINENVLEVKELQRGRWKVSYRAESSEKESDQDGKAVRENRNDEGATKSVGRRTPVGGESRHEQGRGEGAKVGVARQGIPRPREMPGVGLVRGRPPSRTLEAKDEYESKDEFTSPQTPRTMTETELGEQDASEVVRVVEPLSWEQSPKQEQPLNTRILQMKKNSPETHQAARINGTKHLHSQQHFQTQSTAAPSPSNFTHTDRDFTIKSYLSVPHPSFTQKAVLQEKWVRELQNFLKTQQTQQVSVVTANDDHEVVVLNWLISAVVFSNFSLENTLVLALSPNLAKLLQSKGIPTIFIDPLSIISDSARTKVRTAFSRVHIVRITVFRLINHWGYDLVWYDSDAVVLKNPQPLFDKYPDAGLVGSAGKGPSSLGGAWGRTICTGVLLMRSSQNMELYWEKMSKIARYPFTDQGLVNYALQALHVQWYQKPRFVSEDQVGRCETGMEAVILSEEVICRYTCDEKKRRHYYVWHKPAIFKQRTVVNKIDRAQSGHAWFLRKDWKTRGEYTGIDWLRAISENTSR